MITQTNVSETIRELEAAISSGGTGKFALLSLCDNFFPATTDEEKELIENVETEFASIVHDLRNIATIFRRMETMVSVPDVEENELNAYLSADIDLFFSYVQSICDYLAAALMLLFPGPQAANRCNFGTLSNWYQNHQQNSADSVVTRLRDRILGAAWIREVRTIRNEMVHGEALPYVTIPLRSQDILFQILKGDSPMINRTALDERMFSNDVYTYVMFKPFAGAVLGKVLSLLNDISELFIVMLSRRIIPSAQLDRTTVPLNNMALPLHWIELGIQSLTDTDNRRGTDSSAGVSTKRAKVLAFIESKLTEIKESIQTQVDLEGRLVEVSGLIDILTNKDTSALLPSQRDQSVYSFRAGCVKRKFKNHPKRQLAELVEILSWLQKDIESGKQNSLGELDHNWTAEHLQMLITPFPARFR